MARVQGVVEPWAMALTCTKYIRSCNLTPIAEAANLSKDDLRHREIQTVMRTIFVVQIIQFATLAISPDTISTTGGLLCVTSIQFACCVLYRRRLPMSPDLYDVNTGLSRKQKKNLRGKVSNMRTILLSYMGVIVMATLVIQMWCSYGYVAAVMGLDGLFMLSRIFRTNEPALVAITFGLYCVRGYFPSAIADGQHQIRTYCVLSK